MKKRRALGGALLTLALFLAVGLRGDSRTPANQPASSLAAPPHIVLWAWEEPEDLRAADPARLGVAFLAERVFLGNKVTIVPRLQRILVPEGIWAEAVVRFEPGPGFVDNESTRRATADAVLGAARLPAIRGVEIDFDATPPQRAFYADVLREVRAALPPSERLEITALVSWCAQPRGWIETLPIDVAIPMNFRLGQHIGSWPVREPLCSGAIGISTDEPEQQYPASATPQPRTLYIFAPRPWSPNQIAVLNQGHIPQDTQGAR